MKKYSVRVFSQNQASSMGEFIKNVYLESGVFVENIRDMSSFLLSKSYTDCLFLDFSRQDSYDFDFSQLFADIHSLFCEGYIYKIYIICDKEWLVPDSFHVCLTRDVSRDRLVGVLGDIATSVNATGIDVMTRNRNIVMNNLCSDGFSTRHNGTIMLVDAIIRAILSKKMIINLRKDVYPYLMQKYHVSNSCIELSIAKAITCAYSRCDNSRFSSIPTNKELLTYKICELYDYLTDK